MKTWVRFIKRPRWNQQVTDRCWQCWVSAGWQEIRQTVSSSLEFNPHCDSAAGWEGPPPPRGCEVFVGKIPRDMYEDELVPLFETAGRMYEFRLMMEFSGENRGYAFVMYTNRWLRAVQHSESHLKHVKYILLLSHSKTQRSLITAALNQSLLTHIFTVGNEVLLLIDCGAERRLRGPSRCWTTTRSARGSSSACAWVWTTAASSSAPSPKTRGRTRSWRRWSRYQHRQSSPVRTEPSPLCWTEQWEPTGNHGDQFHESLWSKVIKIWSELIMTPNWELLQSPDNKLTCWIIARTLSPSINFWKKSDLKLLKLSF